MAVKILCDFLLPCLALSDEVLTRETTPDLPAPDRSLPRHLAGQVQTGATTFSLTGCGRSSREPFDSAPSLHFHIHSRLHPDAQLEITTKSTKSNIPDMGTKLGQLPKGSDRPPAPKGNHLAICVRVYDMGTQKEEWKGKAKLNRKVRFGFELPEEKHVFSDEKGPQPFVVDVTYNMSSFDGSNFYKAMESWTGEAPDEDFDIEDMLGKPAMVNITHTTKDGKIYGNIDNITPVPKSVVKAGIPDPENKPQYWSVENGRDAAFEKLPDFLKKMAESSIEWNTETPDDAAASMGQKDEDGEPDWDTAK